MTAGPILTTERLILTPVDLGDYDDLCALWGDPVFTRLIMGRGMSPEEVWFRLLRDIGHWTALGHGNWGVRLKDGGDYVGSVGVLNYRRTLATPFDAPELGWGVAPGLQGRGFAFEALRAALDWTDTVMKAPRTVCMISPENAPSIRLAERVGYVPYGVDVYQGAEVTLFQRTVA